MASFPTGVRCFSYTYTTDGNGNISVPHGMSTTPVGALVDVNGDNAYLGQIQAITKTALTVRVANMTNNADITSTSVTVNGIAWTHGLGS